MTTIYVVDLFKDGEETSPIQLAFDTVNPSNITRSMFKNEHPIRIVSINGKNSGEDQYAIAYSLEYPFGVTILSSINYNGTLYRSSPQTDYLFHKKPAAKIGQDSMLLYMSNLSDLHGAIIVPLDNSIPFMTSSGVFCSEYTMVMQRGVLGNWTDCNIRATSYDGGKYILNKSTEEIHVVDFASTFQEMSVLEIDAEPML